MFFDYFILSFIDSFIYWFHLLKAMRSIMIMVILNILNSVKIEISTLNSQK